MSIDTPHIITIGRDETRADIVISEPVVSSLHAQIRHDPQHGYIVEDLGSANGTWLVSAHGDVQVSPGQPLVLTPNCILRFGREIGMEVTTTTIRKLMRPQERLPALHLQESPLKHFSSSTLRLFVPAPDTPPPAQAAPSSQGSSEERSSTRSQGRTGTTNVDLSRSTLGTWLVGSGLEADIVVNAPMVSRGHLEAKLAPGGRSAYVRDLESTNGLFLNAHEARITEATVSHDDILFLGSYRLPASLLISQLEEIVAGTQVKLPSNGTAVLGRHGAGADIEIL